MGSWRSRPPSRRATSRCAGQPERRKTPAPRAALFARSPSLVRFGRRPGAARGGRGALAAEDALPARGRPCARDESAIDRILLSDPRGAPIALEGTELRAGERVIDLSAPLEWRAFLFLESAGPLGSVVQATWVRQAGAELVLVAPQADTRDPHPRGARVQTIPDAPPPAELRIAIERLFMAPLRHALDRAPRSRRASSSMATARREGPAPTTPTT